MLRAVAVVAPLYFFINTALVAGAVALSTRQGVAQVWQRNFLWSAPSFIVGAVLAALAAAAWERGLIGWLLLLAASMVSAGAAPDALSAVRRVHVGRPRYRARPVETFDALDRRDLGLPAGAGSARR